MRIHKLVNTIIDRKVFPNEKKAHVGMEPSKSSKQDGNDTTTHYPYSLYHFANYALCLLVVCIAGLWKTVGLELGYCCMLMCVESVYVVGGCSVVGTEHGRYSLSCMQKL